MPRRNFYKAVIFNLDGVLLDTERIICDAWKRAGGGLGFPLSEPLVRTLIGMSPADAEDVLVKLYGKRFPFAIAHQRMMTFMAAYTDNYGVAVQPGVHAVLDTLDRLHAPRAVISTAGIKATSTLLLNTSLFPRVDAFITAEDVGAAALPPALYLAAAERLNIEIERCLVFENSDAGVRAAHTAGATVILVPHMQPLLPFILPYVYQVEPSLEDVVEELPSLLAQGEPDTRWKKSIAGTTHTRTHKRKIDG
ncbi:MAG: HAD family phosphatase [bacterium]